uniref:Protein sleepless n=1 Tax=Anopheles stephensi TaxID=30069 RepID=A0A182YN72_ANOST
MANKFVSVLMVSSFLLVVVHFEAVNDRVVVSRSCAYEDINTPPNSCVNAQTPSYIKTEFCETCLTDGCNGAAQYGPAALMILISALVAKLLACTLSITDCKQVEQKEHLPQAQATMCRKIRQKVHGEWRYFRSCAFMGEPGIEGDERFCLMRSGTYNIFMEYCTCNSKDGCNTASSRSPTVLLVLGAAVLLVLQAAVHGLRRA